MQANSMGNVPSSSRGTIVGLQGLRFIAASMVVLTHTLNRTTAVFPGAPVRQQPFLESGVDIFFIISGFIMVYILRPDSRALEFWLHRFGRIAPLYWFFTVIAFAGGLIAPAYFLGAISPALAVKSLFFVPVGPDSSFHPAIGPGWTLIYEFAFYTALSVCLVFSRRPLLAVTMVILVVLCAGALSPKSVTWLHFYADQGLMVEFILGIGLALLIPHNDVPPVAGWPIALVGLVLIYLLWNADIAYPRGLKIGVPAFLVVGGILVSEPFWQRHGWLKRLGRLGDASYSIYIVHFFLMQAIWTLFSRYSGLKIIGPFGFIAVMMLAGIGAGLLAHHYIEKPMLDLVRRALGPSRDGTRIAAKV